MEARPGVHIARVLRVYRTLHKLFPGLNTKAEIVTVCRRRFADVRLSGPLVSHTFTKREVLGASGQNLIHVGTRVNLNFSQFLSVAEVWIPGAIMWVIVGEFKWRTRKTDPQQSVGGIPLLFNSPTWTIA